jgi:SAM-dependent methyltransferase
MDNPMREKTLPEWLGCPVCQGPLDRTKTSLHCPADSLDFPLQDGIFRLLPPGEREAAGAYAEEYRQQREAQGWRPLAAEELSALPDKAPAGWDPLYWPARRQSFATLSTWLETVDQPAGNPLRVVDMGAGFGWLAGRLAARGYEVVALDLSDDDAFGLGAVRETAGDYARPPLLAQGDVERPPLQPGQVDLLIFNASLHYAVDLKKCLRSAAELLRPGGAMIIMDTPVLVGDFTALQPAEGQPLRRGRQLPLAELEQALTAARLDFESRQLKRGWRWSMRQWRIRFFGGPGFTLPFIIARLKAES